MAFRNFPGMSKQWLLERLEKVCIEIADGKSMTAGNAGETGFEKTLDPTLDPRTRRDLILADLNVLDPVGYPLADIAPITRTTVIWS